MTNPKVSEADVSKGICSVEDCDRGVLAKGWCSRHYSRHRRHGDPLFIVVKDRVRLCSVDGCLRAGSKGFGYCGKHYQRFVKYGTHELPERERPLCAGPGCSTTLDPLQHSSGLCKSHYKQQHLGKPLTPLQVATKDLGRPEVCSVDGCERPHKARGLCKTHNQWTQVGKDLFGQVQPRLPPGPCSLDGCDGLRLANNLCAKHNARWSAYRMTHQDALDLLASQAGRCAICLVPYGLDELHLDHDHACCTSRPTCGQCARGLLCPGCNIGIGYLRDSVERLESAIKYLTR